MLKKFIASSAAGLLAVSSIAASATPIAFESADRTASSIDASEKLEGENGILIALLAAAAVIAGIILIQDSEGSVDDLPTSP